MKKEGKMKLRNILNVCQKCKAECCKMGGPDFTEKEMKRVLKTKFKNCFVEINKNHYELKSKRGICPYLRKNFSCKIHKVRPLMCKCWPVYLRFRENKRMFILAECPLTPLLPKKEIEEMKKQAIRIPKELVKTSFSNSKLPKSDLKLIEKRFNKFKKKRLR